jgi:hypothetical protein
MSGRSYQKGREVAKAADEGDEIAQEQWGLLEADEQSIHGAYSNLDDDDSEAGKISRGDDDDDNNDDDEPFEYLIQVKDNGSYVTDATVHLGSQTQQTDELGMASFEMEEEGDYALTIEADGYETYQKQITVQADQEMGPYPAVLTEVEEKTHSVTVSSVEYDSGADTDAHVALLDDGEVVADGHGAHVEFSGLADQEYTVEAYHEEAGETETATVNPAEEDVVSFAFNVPTEPTPEPPGNGDNGDNGASNGDNGDNGNDDPPTEYHFSAEVDYDGEWEADVITTEGDWAESGEGSATLDLITVEEGEFFDVVVNVHKEDIMDEEDLTVTLCKDGEEVDSYTTHLAHGSVQWTGEIGN